MQPVPRLWTSASSRRGRPHQDRAPPSVGAELDSPIEDRTRGGDDVVRSPQCVRQQASNSPSSREHEHVASPKADDQWNAKLVDEPWPPIRRGRRSARGRGRSRARRSFRRTSQCDGKRQRLGRRQAEREVQRPRPIHGRVVDDLARRQRPPFPGASQEEAISWVRPRERHASPVGPAPVERRTGRDTDSRCSDGGRPRDRRRSVHHSGRSGSAGSRVGDPPPAQRAREAPPPGPSSDPKGDEAEVCRARGRRAMQKQHRAEERGGTSPARSNQPERPGQAHRVDLQRGLAHARTAEMPRLRGRVEPHVAPLRWLARRDRDPLPNGDIPRRCRPAHATTRAGSRRGRPTPPAPPGRGGNRPRRIPAGDKPACEAPRGGERSRGRRLGFAARLEEKPADDLPFASPGNTTEAPRSTHGTRRRRGSRRARRLHPPRPPADSCPRRS